MEEIAGGKGPEAIVCYNDEVALGLCAALRERGRKVPRDVSIISFDNSAFAGLAHPALTTLEPGGAGKPGTGVKYAKKKERVGMRLCIAFAPCKA